MKEFNNLEIEGKQLNLWALVRGLYIERLRTIIWSQKLSGIMDDRPNQNQYFNSIDITYSLFLWFLFFIGFITATYKNYFYTNG